MRILVTGGTGFVGKSLIPVLLAEGHEVVAIGRTRRLDDVPHPGLVQVSADTTHPGDWQGALKDVDAVVNMAGVSIFGRWNAAYKRQLADSRILTTRHVVEGLRGSSCATLISTSAVGFYGDRKNDILEETEPGGRDFLARLSQDWESEARKAEEIGIRTSVCRFGVVMGGGGGALEQMIRPFKLFTGGPIGNGKQWFSWIHMTDLLEAIRFLLERSDIHGVFNFCAPNPLRNQEVAEILGKLLHRPAILPTPAFALRLALGEFADTLLASHRVVPTALLRHGFRFRFPDLESALADLLRN